MGTALAMFISGVCTARALGDDGRGVYLLAINVGSLGALLLSLRWQRPTGYFLAQDAANLPAIVGSNLLMGVVTVAAAVAAWFLYPPLYEVWLLKNVPAPIVWLAIGLIADTYIWQSVTAIYGGLREFTPRAWFMLATALAGLVAPVGLYLLGSTDVWEYLLWQLALGAALKIGWVIVLMARRGIRPSIHWPLTGRMLRYTGLTYASVILDLVIVRLDLFIMNAITQEDEGLGMVGIYGVAVGLASQLSRIPLILGTVVFNRVSANEMGRGEVTARIFRLTLLVTGAAGAVLGVAGYFLIVPIYTADFAGSVPAFLVLIPAVILIGLFRILASDIDGRGKPGLVSLCSLLSAIVIVVLDFWWIPIYGVMGAAWASLISYAIAALSGAVVFRRLTGMSYREAYLPRWGDVVALVDGLSRALKRRRAPAPGEAG